MEYFVCTPLFLYIKINEVKNYKKKSLLTFESLTEL